jgi:hypothetical protein
VTAAREQRADGRRIHAVLRQKGSRVGFGTGENPNGGVPRGECACSCGGGPRVSDVAVPEEAAFADASSTGCTRRDVARASPQAARRSYRWCKPPTSAKTTTPPSVGAWMRRGMGASFLEGEMVRVQPEEPILPTEVPAARPARPPPLPLGRSEPWYDADDVTAALTARVT